MQNTHLAERQHEFAAEKKWIDWLWHIAVDWTDNLWTNWGLRWLRHKPLVLPTGPCDIPCQKLSEGQRIEHQYNESRPIDVTIPEWVESAEQLFHLSSESQIDCSTILGSQTDIVYCTRDVRKSKVQKDKPSYRWKIWSEEMKHKGSVCENVVRSRSLHAPTLATENEHWANSLIFE